jgi:hypothetical protein
VQLRTVRGRLLAADRAVAAPGLRVDLGRARRLRPLVLAGRFRAVTLTRRIARSP